MRTWHLVPTVGGARCTPILHDLVGYITYFPPDLRVTPDLRAPDLRVPDLPVTELRFATDLRMAGVGLMSSWLRIPEA